MAGEIVVVGTPVVLEAAGAAAIVSGAVGAVTAAYDRDADGGGFPHVRFILSAPFGGAPAALKTVAILVQSLDIDGANDGPVPSGTYPHRRLCLFRTSADATQYLDEVAYDVPQKFLAYVYNVDTAQQINTGWKLVAIPFTHNVAA